MRLSTKFLFLCGIFCCCAIGAGAGTEAPANVPEAVKPAGVTEPAPAEVKLSRTLEELGAGDPFRYSVSGTDDYTPTSSNRFVSGILIKGIIRMAGEAPPLALLYLSEGNRNFYVRKGDVIRVPTPKNGSAVTETYLQVKDIRDDEVEVIQKERPDRVIIVR